MSEPFKASFIKIERAKKHIREIEELAADFLASDPATVRFDPNPPEGMKMGFQFHFSVKGMPSELCGALGDAIHNLRSALDLMASDLCRLNNASPDDVLFPFCENESYLDSMIKRRNFNRAGEAAVRLLKEWKPYIGGNKELRAIHDLDVQDKHQMLIPGAVGVASPILELYDENKKPYLDVDGNPAPKIHGDPNRPSSVQLQFPVDSALAGQALIATLHDLVDLTTSIIESFKALSTPTG